MLVDSVKIKVQGGKGGDGAVSFRREKYLPKGGPDGGDGGRGGKVIIEADNKVQTLAELYKHPHQKAENGESGGRGNKKGKDGQDLIIKVPVGTMVEDTDKSLILADLVKNGQQLVVAKGGRGGVGNFRFKSSTQRKPGFALKGEPGEEKRLGLNLKLIADVGLVGYVNTGKSTLLAQISSARPRIADYPFTTLTPHLGVVKVNEIKSLVVVDTPGLIEGAHQGAGLGNKFLKHLERTEVILHLVDGANIKKENPLYYIRIINQELKRFSEELAKKPQIIAVNKSDLPEAKENFDLLREALVSEEYSGPIFFLSALTGEGVKDLVDYLSSFLDKVKVKEEKEEKELVLVEDLAKEEAIYKFIPRFIINKKGNTYEVSGGEVERLVAITEFDNPEAVEYFQKIIKKIGLERALIKEGIKEGDEVKIRGKVFTFFPK